MDKLLDKLREWIKVIQAALLGTIIIEAILVIVIGIASNKINDTFDHWTGILLACSVFYIFLIVIKAAYQFKFPSSIVDELISKRQLEEKNKLFERQKAINEYINSAIQGLNKQTCSIDTVADNEHLCDKELEVRLTELLQPIVSYTDVILDTSTEKKFTIGIHLDAYQKFPSNYEEVEINEVEWGVYISDYDPISDKGLLILRDELELLEILPKNLVDEERISGAAYEIQTAIKRTLNNLTFNTHDFSYNDKKYSIICSEILEVCSDDYVNGVLFIIHHQGISFPTDVSEILGIFNRITANYVSKYNSCIVDEIISKKKKNNIAS
ncbi:hypothetical protein NAT47_07180 [Flavobacterium sp. HXWNR69]|uniref:Uncharacterized protein n=1 Tax=Flavobacterium fragile TaxID=2949085 RepID=A0ABT0TGU3_9FLAO|nr:hypothetical protein [Flavobacterium sp. HXWNR69]MCL9770195.1 hypothetical protein [Flavobacterium sp. HXWNR69]